MEVDDKNAMLLSCFNVVDFRMDLREVWRALFLGSVSSSLYSLWSSTGLGL